MIAWKLTTDFNKERHLFYSKIGANYSVDTYRCNCGRTECIIKHVGQDVQYECEDCCNTTFYDANSAWTNIEHFLGQNKDLKLSYRYSVEKNSDSIIINYTTEIPNAIDFLSTKMLFSNKPVYSLVLTSDGELKENYSLEFKKNTYLEVRQKLTTYINDNGCFSVPDSRDKFLSLTAASFFLKRKHLKDFDLYYWDSVGDLNGDVIYIDTAFRQILNNRKEKSIQKALYKNYLNQIDQYGKFYSFLIDDFTKIIRDANIIVNFLKIDFDYNYLDNLFDKKDIYQVISFLKNFYLEKQILRLFNRDEFTNNPRLFYDLVWEYNESKNIIQKNFKKVPCSTTALHNEFIRCTKYERYKEIQNKVLIYSKHDLKACKEIDTYSVKLPKNGGELFYWAENLHNCMASYFQRINTEKTIIYGFFKEDSLIFAVEISNRSIVQASAKYNATLSIKEREVMQKWFALNFLENKQGVEHVA